MISLFVAIFKKRKAFDCEIKCFTGQKLFAKGFSSFVGGNETPTGHEEEETGDAKDSDRVSESNMSIFFLFYNLLFT